MNTYQEKFADMINKANSKGLVEELYDECCTYCEYGLFCNECTCGVTLAKDNALNNLKNNGKMLIHFNIILPKEEKPKASPKPKTAEEKAAKACIRFLDRVYDKTNDKDLKELIDDVTVQLCLGDTRAIDRLKEHYDVLYYKLARLWWKYTSTEESKKEVK